MWMEDMRPGGFEPPTHSLEGCCSIQLSYGRILRTSRPHYSNPGPATVSPPRKPPSPPRRMVGVRTHLKEAQCFDSVRCWSGSRSA